MNDAMARAEAARRKYVYAGTKNPTLAGFAFFITGELMQLSMWVADKLPYQIVRLVFLPLTDASHRIAMYLSREHR